MRNPVVAVFAGGVSRERTISERSAAFVTESLRDHFQVELFDVRAEALPAGVDPGRHVVFSTLHGTFGEDGGMQALLDAAGIVYAGSDAVSSRLCMNKEATKRRVREAGVNVADGVCFAAHSVPEVRDLTARLGHRLVLKPNGEGSSIGLHFVEGQSELGARLAALEGGDWLLEQRIDGRELTVGVLEGRAMGVVEIMPQSGRYDYESKYTRGRTEYRVPAGIPGAAAEEVRRAAEIVFSACGCRDFARVDFILDGRDRAWFLEINTLPGLTGTSLLPMSASSEGFGFSALARRLIMPAIERYNHVGERVQS